MQLAPQSGTMQAVVTRRKPVVTSTCRDPFEEASEPKIQDPRQTTSTILLSSRLEPNVPMLSSGEGITGSLPGDSVDLGAWTPVARMKLHLRLFLN